jgi:hypothetical protein
VSTPEKIREQALGLAAASGRERYASGVQEALRWVLGEEPWADLERLIEEED